MPRGVEVSEVDLRVLPKERFPRDKGGNAADPERAGGHRDYFWFRARPRSCPVAFRHEKFKRELNDKELQCFTEYQQGTEDLIP